MSLRGFFFLHIYCVSLTQWSILIYTYGYKAPFRRTGEWIFHACLAVLPDRAVPSGHRQPPGIPMLLSTRVTGTNGRPSCGEVVTVVVEHPLNVWVGPYNYRVGITSRGSYIPLYGKLDTNICMID